MARIIVTTEERERSDASAHLEKRVGPDDPGDEPSEARLTERLGWTLVDATPTSVGWRAK